MQLKNINSSWLIGLDHHVHQFDMLQLTILTSVTDKQNVFGIAVISFLPFQSWDRTSETKLQCLVTELIHWYKFHHAQMCHELLQSAETSCCEG